MTADPNAANSGRKLELNEGRDTISALMRTRASAGNWAFGMLSFKKIAEKIVINKGAVLLMIVTSACVAFRRA